MHQRCVTTGGTESIILACKAYRDKGREDGIEVLLAFLFSSCRTVAMVSFDEFLKINCFCYHHYWYFFISDRGDVSTSDRPRSFWQGGWAAWDEDQVECLPSTFQIPTWEEEVMVRIRWIQCWTCAPSRRQYPGTCRSTRWPSGSRWTRCEGWSGCGSITKKLSSSEQSYVDTVQNQ